MTFNLINTILKTSGIKYAYDHFNGPIKADRYIAYFETDKIVSDADNKVYDWTSSFAIELYTKKKEPETEQILIDLFETYEIPWTGGASTYIESESVYQTVFYV